MSGEEDAPLIESRADLIEVMSVGGKPKSEWRIGTEHEKHVYRKDPVRPVPYEGEDGIHALLDGIEKRTGWHPFFYRGNPIGLRNMGAIGGISLERAVAQASAAGANAVMAYDRGRIAEGLAADMIVFDYQTISDKATFARPSELSTGMKFVLVNGVVVLDNGRFTGQLPGRVLRGPGYRHDNK